MTRVLYSFPTRLGTTGIGTTAYEQVAGLARDGHDVTVVCGSLERPLPAGVAVRETMRVASARVPYRLVGKDRALAHHDRRVARLLAAAPDRHDVVHAWPLGAEATLAAAQEHGVASVLERPNAHTAFAFAAVAEVLDELGLEPEPGSPHRPDRARLAREEREYALADALLCPSDFVARTFRERGVPAARLLRHRYGCDPARFAGARAGDADRAPGGGPAPLTVLFAGRGEPRKGLHLALRAWMACGAADEGGRFVVAGAIDPSYRPVLAGLLAHPSVHELGFVDDVPACMRAADVLVLPSVEEGSALVTYEARAAGCVLVVSDRTGAPATHGHDALVHAAGDVAALREHLGALHRDVALRQALRRRSVEGAGELTWAAAAEVLAGCYDAVRARRAGAVLSR